MSAHYRLKLHVLAAEVGEAVADLQATANVLLVLGENLPEGSPVAGSLIRRGERLQKVVDTLKQNVVDALA